MDQVYAHERVRFVEFVCDLGLDIFGVFGRRKLEEEQTVLIYWRYVSGHVHVHAQYRVIKIDCRRNSASVPKVSCLEKGHIPRRADHVSLDNLRVAENLKPQQPAIAVKLVWGIVKNKGPALYGEENRQKTIWAVNKNSPSCTQKTLSTCFITKQHVEK